eukprot:COSAG02_NODE_63521_length_263_cov_0.615854_1_plen_49_part_10
MFGFYGEAQAYAKGSVHLAMYSLGHEVRRGTQKQKQKQKQKQNMERKRV